MPRHCDPHRPRAPPDACLFCTRTRFGASYTEILECLKESQVVELDEKNETIRCRDKPEQVQLLRPSP